MSNMDMRQIFRDLASQGFRVEGAKKGWKIFPPNREGGVVVVHSTPSDRRALQNIMTDLRRAGFKDGKARRDESESS